MLDQDCNLWAKPDVCESRSLLEIFRKIIAKLFNNIIKFIQSYHIILAHQLSTVIQFTK